MTESLVLAETSWPEAAMGIAGIGLVAAVVVTLVWQGFATWRSRLQARRDDAYRALAEQVAADLREIRARLDALERDAGGRR